MVFGRSGALAANIRFAGKDSTPKSFAARAPLLIWIDLSID
jgi:hypothetical protein